MERGQIANINGRYVILNDKRKVEDLPILSMLLPEDIVEYAVFNNIIHISKLLERKPHIYLGIIKSISNKIGEVCIPGLPKHVHLFLSLNESIKIHSALLLKATIHGNVILKTYSSIKQRENDKDLFLNLYLEQANLCSALPQYTINSNSSYTDSIQNLTHLNTFTVDPTESKDFDDAISFDEGKGKIYVHIVDAHRQIKPSSMEETQALQRAFTLYLPEHIENILPRHLAEEEMSLIADEERKVVTVEFEIDTLTQTILRYSLYPSIIKVKKRYDYKEFNDHLQDFPFLLTFYFRWRRETFNIPHVKLHINRDTGKLSSATLDDYFDDAHRLIETLMILANLTVSQHVQLPQRYHCRVKEEMTLIPYTGNTCIDAILTIKNYKPAIYDNQQSGHFGLGLSTYTHFTSPIRRYFDVIVHRMLAGIQYENAEEILAHINAQERFIDKSVVQCYNNCKWLTYFEENLSKLWPGFIITVTNNGATVILEESLYEVFVFSSISLTVGQRVQIKIKNVDWFSLCVKAAIV